MKDKPKYYRAKEGFFAGDYGDGGTHVAAGEIVSVGHPLLKRREQLFEPVPSFGRFDTSEVEQATAAPGEKRAIPKRRRRPPKKAPPAQPAVKQPAPFGLTTANLKIEGVRVAESEGRK